MTHTLVLTLDQPQDWISANRRYHWARRAELTRYWRHLATAKARQARLPRVEHARVVITYHRADHRDFDPTNLAPTSKAIVDGIVDAGVFSDDSWHHVDGPDERRGEPGERRIVITIHPTQERAA